MTAAVPSDEDVDRVADLLDARIGLRPERTLRSRIRRCISDGATARRQSIPAYLESLLEAGDALQQLIDRVTVQETSFFRHPEQFRVLAEEVLPRLPRPVAIWSAGCANGQEAYSLAMLLAERAIPGSVVATDLSTTALQRTVQGRYHEREVSGLSSERLERYLTRSGDVWQVDETLRSRVRVLRHNLIDPLPAEVRGSHVVFCRNVLIYFTAEHARIFLDRVADILPADGRLVLGASETIRPLSTRFETLRAGDAFLYRPFRAGLAPAVAPLRSPARPPARERLTLLPAARPRPTLTSAAPPAAVATATPAATATSAATAAVAGVDSAEEAAGAGRQALDIDDHRAAIVAFRRWAYLAPDNALAHLHLGLALEAADEHRSARRAFAAAHRLVGDDRSAPLESAMEGYAVDELRRMLEAKATSPHPQERQRP